MAPHVSYLQAQAAFNKERFQKTYGVCNTLSLFHDLSCGHRVQAATLSDHCGANCLVKARGRPFACPDCIIADVRLEMTFESISLANNDDDIEMSDDGVFRSDKIRNITASEIQKRRQQGYRVCIVIKKFKDPKMQFFDQFLKADGFPGIGEEDPASLKPGHKFKRPGRSTRLPTLKAREASNRPFRFYDFDVWKPHETVDPTDEEEVVVTVAEMEKAWEETPLGTYRFVKLSQGAPTGGGMDDFTDMFRESRIGSLIEDDATKAVREALQGFVLGASGARC
jgi:hypothetical protein